MIGVSFAYQVYTHLLINDAILDAVSVFHWMGREQRLGSSQPPNSL
jgi:hypothetical protein